MPGIPVSINRRMVGWWSLVTVNCQTLLITESIQTRPNNHSRAYLLLAWEISADFNNLVSDQRMDMKYILVIWLQILLGLSGSSSSQIVSIIKDVAGHWKVT